MAKPLPCQKCGGEMVIEDEGYEAFLPHCLECGLMRGEEGTCYTREADAVRGWNRFTLRGEFRPVSP